MAESSNVVGLKYVAEGLDEVLASTRQYRDALQGLEQTSQRTATRTTQAGREAETAWSLAMQKYTDETQRAARLADTAWSVAMQKAASETQKAASAIDTAWSLAMQRSAAETKRAADAAETAWSLAMQRSAAETQRAANATETAWSLAMQRVAEETRRAAAVVAASTAYNQLRASMDSAVSASQRYVAAQQVVRDAHAQGVITTRQMDAALKRLEQSFEAAQLQRYAEAQRKISSEIINGNAAVNRINAAFQQMTEKVRAGTLTSRQHIDAMKALARELAATNGYLTQSGALNTQKALAELRAAQATRDATAADAAAAAAKAKLTTSYQQLLASVNPVIARKQQTKQVTDMLRAAVNAQAITVQQAAQALLQYRASLNALNTTAGQVSQRLNQKGVIIQQLGYQMGDFAVQVQSGTNVMVALGQQATQVIGTFAAFATSVRTVAILSTLGVVVPILTAVGAAMMRTSGSAKTLEQRVNDLTTASDRLKGTLEILTGDDMDLAVRFGDMATAIRDSADAMRELDRASELKNLVSVVEGFGKAVQPGLVDAISSPGYISTLLSPSAGNLLLGLGNLGRTATGQTTVDLTGAQRDLQENTFQERTGFQMGLDAYEAYIEGMRAAAVRGDVPELNRVFQQFIDDATDGGTAVDKITLAGGALAAEMMRVNTLIAESNARYNGTAESAKRVLNFEQERARLMERDLGAAQEIQLAQAAAQFGKDSLRYRQEERAVARQSYAEQLNAQVQQNKLTVDQASDLLSIYDTTQSIVEAEDRRVDAQRRLTEAYRQYATSRASGEDSVAAGEKMLAQMQEQTRLQVAINTYGKDSVQALAIQRAQHEAIVREQIEQMGLADSMESRLIAAAMALYDAEAAANGLKNELKGAAAAMAALAGVGDGIEKKIAVAQARVAALKAGANAVVAAEVAAARFDLNQKTQAALQAGNTPDAVAALYAPQAELIKVLESTLTEQKNLEESTREARKAAGKGDPLADLLREQEQRRVLLSLSGQQRTLQEEIFKVQQKLGDSAKTLSQAQIAALAQENLLLQEQERLRQEQLAAQQNIANTIQNQMEGAFMSILDGTKSAKDAFKDMARAVIAELLRVLVVQRLVGSFNAATGAGTGLMGILGPLFGSANGNVFRGGGMVPFANGGAFYNGNVMPFADGGVVSSPTLFPMRNGTGLMGEAGPEAIMPLKRTSSGKLGVVAEGGGAPVTVVQNFHIAANGDESVRRIVRDEAPLIAEQAKAAVLDAKRRGGAYGKAF